MIEKTQVRTLWLVAALAAVVTACGGARTATAPPGVAPDQFLYERGQMSLMEQNWLQARTYFQQVVDNYPQSPRRPDAKLGLGDSYLGENSAESVVFAANEYREFLQFYPIHARADYAQYKLAMSHFQQMRAPARDQTETREALREFDIFFERFPESALTPEVKQRWREARDRLSEASFLVGQHYYRVEWYPGAIDRFREVLRDDPAYSGRDAVYYHLAESLYRTEKKPEALPYYERLLAEFPMSEYREDSLERVQELKAQ
ncbi:MAG: outer membrane protein assembly factor BamD [Vicinamibacterales bacterium]